MRLVSGRIVSDSVVARRTLPPVPLSGDQAQNRFNTAVAEAITEMRTGKNRAVTFPELATGVAGVLPPEDTRVPPAPVGLEAAGAFRNIMLTWDYPAYSYHAFTRIFRANVDNFEQAVVIANTEAKVWADNVGSGQAFYYWVANVSRSGIQSAPNGVAGTRGETAPDVDFLLATLAGQVLESTLHASLSDRIDLIDGPDTMPGSVAARVKTETDARTTADSALSTRIDTVSATTNNNSAAIQTEQTARANADGAISTRIDTLQTSYDGQFASVQTTQTAHGDAITGLQAEWTVKVDVNGHVAGIGIASDVTASQIEMLADRFAIVIPGVNGGTPAVPFVATTINGVAGVGITNAFIGDAAITRAKIDLLAVDDARIANLSAAKVTFGEMSGNRISVNSLNADRIITSTLVAKLATITDAYIVNANINNLTIGTEKFTPNAMSNCAYCQLATGGSGGGFTQNTWVDFDTANTTGGSGGGAGGGPIGGGTGGGGLADTSS